MLKKFVLGGMTALVLAACGGEGGSASSSVPAQTASASGSLIERINNKGTITVGTEGTYAPFTYHDKDGKLTGYDVEVTRAVADKLGVKVEFKEEFYKRQDKVEAVKEQYPQEMKVLEEFFNAPEDWVRERKKFFSELAQNKELLAEITNTNNVQSELLEQGSGRIFRKGSDSNEQAVTEQKRNVLEVTPKHIMDKLLIVEDELDTLICNEQYLTELYAPNTENIVCKSNGILLVIDAPNATTIECRDCEMLEKINAPNCVKLICEGSDFLKKEDIEVAYNCEIEGLKEQRGIKM